MSMKGLKGHQIAKQCGYFGPFVPQCLGSNNFKADCFFPQIAIAIGVLTSNRGGDDEPLWRIGRGTRVPLQGAVDVVPLQGAIVGCHCSVLWLRGRVFGGADVVPLLGAIAGCHCSVLWWGEGRATHFTQTPRKQQWILSWTSCRRYTVLYIDSTKIGFGYLGSMLV